jgi:hypothetical protein
LQHEKTSPDKANKYIRQIEEAATWPRLWSGSFLHSAASRCWNAHIVDLNSILKDLGKMLPRLLGEDVQVLTAPSSSIEPIG